MNMYERINNCAEEELFELVTSDPELVTDGIYEIIEKYKARYPKLESYYEYSDAGECIRSLDSLLVNETILVVSESLATDDLLFKVLPTNEVGLLINQFGYSFASNYVPVKLLPSLWSTPLQQINLAIESYARGATNSQSNFSRLIQKLNKYEAFLLRHWWLFIAGLVLFLFVTIING